MTAVSDPALERAAHRGRLRERRRGGAPPHRGQGADVNAKDETVQSAYLVATSEVGDDPSLLELALANGADVELARQL